MRIGFDAKRLFHNGTGLGHYSRNLLSALCKNDTSSAYFLYNPKPGKYKMLHPCDNVKEVCPQGFFWKKCPSLWRQTGILQQIKNNEIDVYHGLSGELPIGIHRIGVKTAVTIHDLIPMRYPHLFSPLNRFIYNQKSRYAARRADIIVAMSEQTKADVVSFLNISPEKIKVVYQICNPASQQTYTQEDIDVVVKKYRLPSSFILNVGTVEERKNVLTVVKAIKHIDTNLVVVGRATSYKEKVLKYVSENNMSDKVFFLERLEERELAILYQKARIFIYPSIFEGFGIPLIEAMYAKTPVITSTESCLPEVGGPYSIYISPYDVASLASHIETLLQNEHKARQQAEMSYEFVQKFNEEAMAKAMLAIYKSL